MDCPMTAAATKVSPIPDLELRQFSFEGLVHIAIWRPGWPSEPFDRIVALCNVAMHASSSLTTDAPTCLECISICPEALALVAALNVDMGVP